MTLAGCFAAATAAHAAPTADSLLSRARDRARRPTPEDHRLAREDLERATRLAPARADIWLALGRLQQQAGSSHDARHSLSRAAALAPEDAEARLELGRAYKWDWLETLDEDSFRQSAGWFSRASAAAPQRPEAWVELTALALVKGDARLAADAAVHAHEADAEGAGPELALACAAYRLGRLHVADSLFIAARERLAADLAARFDDLELMTGQEPDPRDLAPRDVLAARAESARYWAANDPDLTTPENEAWLGYLSRLGHALLLFQDGDQVRWDLRTELVVRYGIPDRIEFNRPTALLQSLGLAVVPESGADRVEFGYPFNEQVWSYSALGIQARLWDRSLCGIYSLPLSVRSDPDPRADPAALAARPDLVMVGEGRAVYRALPPGMHARSASVQLTRFPTEQGARLLATLTTPAGAGDTLRGTWVVVDAARHERVRGTAALGVSVCDPAGARTADFAADLPPGDYAIGFAVEDTHGGRGLAKRTLRVANPAAGLSLSDLVLLCGSAESAVADRSVRIEPNMDHHVRSGRPLTVYFELSRLATGDGGEARYSYVYRVRRARPGGVPLDAAPPVIETSREEVHVGSLRRQFLQIPLSGLASGAYALEVEVRDLIAGGAAKQVMEFVLDPEAGPARATR